MTVYDVLLSKAKDMKTETLVEELEKANRGDSQAAIENEIVKRGECPECGNDLLSDSDGDLYCPVDDFSFETTEDISSYEQI